MTGYQKRYYAMSLASELFLIERKSTATEIAGLQEYFDIIRSTHAQIHDYLYLREDDRGVILRKKNRLKCQLIAQTADVIRKTSAYAVTFDDNELYDSIHFSETKLNRSSESQLVCICSTVHSKIYNIVDNLEEYGVTRANLDDIQNSLNNLKDNFLRNRSDFASKETVAIELSKYFKILIIHWDKIDSLLETYRIEMPTFYEDYLKVRRVLDSANANLSMKVQIINAVTGLGEPNVTLTLTSAFTYNNIPVPISMNNRTKKTADGGGANYKNLQDGTYTLVAHKQGFKEIVQQVNISSIEKVVLKLVISG